MCSIFIAAKWEKNPTKKPLQWFNICSKYIWALVKCKAKQSAMCPPSHPAVVHLNLCTADATCACESFHVMFRVEWKGGFCLLWRTDRRKCRDHIFSTASETSVACVPLQEGLQRRLVNRKQPHLVRVAFYGLTDSNSISREPEEDTFLSFGLIEWLIWFVTQVCVLCDIESYWLSSSAHPGGRKQSHGHTLLQLYQHLVNKGCVLSWPSRPRRPLVSAVLQQRHLRA